MDLALLPVNGLRRLFGPPMVIGPAYTVAVPRAPPRTPSPWQGPP
ncbi:hypothetical protein ACFHYQ_07830 [Sphaerimonospora cavernae]|uniref:Uncharacterized protein n=1 Tax=Sphaerimonospora cavernae TaxID=1740611 RepID=A0ABV6U198_9ACTN